MNIVEVKVRWQLVSGSTGYEIVKDGVVVGTKGKLATTTSVKVDASTKIEVRALPGHEVLGTVDFSQVSE